MTSFPLRLGVDLKGGVILIYEIDQKALSGDGQIDGADLGVAAPGARAAVFLPPAWPR